MTYAASGGGRSLGTSFSEALPAAVPCRTASFRPDVFDEEMVNETADNPTMKVAIMRFRSTARFPSWKSQRKAGTNLCRSDNRILMNLIELLACPMTNDISKSFSLASVPSVHEVFGC